MRPPFEHGPAAWQTGDARRLALATALALVFLALTHAAAFADAPVVTDYRVSPPDHLTVGDHIGIAITVAADKGTRLQIAPGGIPDALTVAESPKFSNRALPAGRVETKIEFAVAAFTVGDYAMPPIRLRYQDASGNVGELQTPAARLTIESTLPASGSLEPRDLKPQAEVGSPAAPPYELIAVSALLLAIAFAALFAAWRRMSRPVAPMVAAPGPVEVLGPEDAARRALDEAAAAFSAEGDLGACYAALSATVREYLTRRFGFPAFALTTAELQAQMVFRGMDRWQARLVSGLLGQCDAVMFANYRPAVDRAQADITAAYEIIEMSRSEETAEVATA